VLWLGHSLDARSNGAWRRRLVSVHGSIGVRRWLPEVAIAVITVTWVVAGTPILRSQGGTLGDEPKYVRYCETLYQGLGFEISQIKAMSELPADFHPQLWRNFVLLARILPGELRGLASDAVEYVRHPSHQFNRARHLEGGSSTGRTAGCTRSTVPAFRF
jgi:hypothetical protein